MLFNHTSETETSTLKKKLEEIENMQAIERDKVITLNKNMDVRFNDLEAMMKKLLSQVQNNGNSNGNGSTNWQNKQYDPNNGVKLGSLGTMPKWGAGGNSC